MVKKILIVSGIVIIGLIAISIIFAILGGAGKKSYDMKAPSAPSSFEASAPLSIQKQTSDAEQTSSEGTNRLVIRTGTINMVVKDIADSAKSIIQYAENKGGWVVSSMISEREKIPSGSVTVRVPAKIFDETMTYFKGLAEKVSYEGTQGQDVTEEYTDLQSSLKNLEATETQLLKIMERSGTIPDVLAVQKELNKVRSQIEQVKGRIQYLEKSTEMATISMNFALSEELLPIPLSEKWRPIYVIKRAWGSLLGSLKGISYFLIWIGIYAIIWVPLVVIVWQVRKFWKRKEEIKRV